MTRRVALGAISAGGWAQQRDSQRGEVRWEDLWDGKSLAGWRWARPGESGTPSWEVRDGCLRGLPGLGKDVYLLSEAVFDDFELRFRWRCSPGGNSGIKYRIQRYGEPTRRLEPTGLEYQITDDVSNPDALSTPKHSSGAIYDYVAPRKRGPAQADVWHESAIVARGLHIEHWLDGECVVNIDLDSARAEAEFSQSKRLESRRILRLQEKRESPIALQLHDGEILFQAIRVRRLR